MLKVPGVILVQEELLEKLGTLALVVILELMGRLEKWVYKVSMDPKAARVHRCVTPVISSCAAFT